MPRPGAPVVILMVVWRCWIMGSVSVLVGIAPPMPAMECVWLAVLPVWPAPRPRPVYLARTDTCYQGRPAAPPARLVTSSAPQPPPVRLALLPASYALLLRSARNARLQPTWNPRILPQISACLHVGLRCTSTWCRAVAAGVCTPAWTAARMSTVWVVRMECCTKTGACRYVLILLFWIMAVAVAMLAGDSVWPAPTLPRTVSLVKLATFCLRSTTPATWCVQLAPTPRTWLSSVWPVLRPAQPVLTLPTAQLAFLLVPISTHPLTSVFPTVLWDSSPTRLLLCAMHAVQNVWPVLLPQPTVRAVQLTTT